MATNARTFAASLRPGAASTPLTTSTPHGRSVAMASATFSGVSPPAATSFTRSRVLEEGFAAPQPSRNACPVPPTAVAVRESTRIASTLASRAMRAAARSARAGFKMHHAQNPQPRPEPRAQFRRLRLPSPQSAVARRSGRPLPPSPRSRRHSHQQTRRSFRSPPATQAQSRATCSAVTRRGLGANTNPTASAPASAAIIASASEVLAQILIQMLMACPRRLSATPPAPRQDRAGASGFRR